MKFLGIIIVLVIFFFILPRFCFAQQIIINEILPDPEGEDKENEWVELYNPNGNPINIIGYVLEDKNKKRLTISTVHTNGNQEINRWLVVYPKNSGGFALTNTGSEIKLFESTQSATPIDTFSYSDSKSGKSWARIPDGEAIYSEMLVPTPGDSNKIPSSPSPSQDSSPSPSPSLSPSSSPVPSPKPASPSPKALTKISPSPKSSPKPSVSPSASPSVSPPVSPSPTSSAKVLGIREEGKNFFTQIFSSPIFIPVVLVTVGIGFMAVAFTPSILNKLKENGILNR